MFTVLFQLFFSGVWAMDKAAEGRAFCWGFSQIVLRTFVRMPSFWFGSSLSSLICDLPV